VSSKKVADQLDKLAIQLLNEALSAQPPPMSPSRLDVFKAVVQYHVGSTRAARGAPDEPPEGGSFADMKNALESLDKTKGTA